MLEKGQTVQTSLKFSHFYLELSGLLWKWAPILLQPYMDQVSVQFMTVLSGQFISCLFVFFKKCLNFLKTHNKTGLRSRSCSGFKLQTSRQNLTSGMLVCFSWMGWCPSGWSVPSAELHLCLPLYLLLVIRCSNDNVSRTTWVLIWPNAVIRVKAKIKGLVCSQTGLHSKAVVQRPNSSPNLQLFLEWLEVTLKQSEEQGSSLHVLWNLWAHFPNLKISHKVKSPESLTVGLNPHQNLNETKTAFMVNKLVRIQRS